MVRLLIPFIAIILIWLLFFSSFNKRVRIVASIAVIGLSILALYLDMNSRALRSDIINSSQINVCGVKGQFSYRNNFNLDVCLQNSADKGLVKRLEVRFDALSCVAGDCTVLESQTEIINVDLPTGQQIIHRENLEFDQVPETLENIVWAAEIDRVWATK